MRNVYFTVGPSQLYPTVQRHIQTALKNEIQSLNHRGPIFKKLFKEVSDNLKKLLNIPKNYQILFVSSGLESMERILQGCTQNCSYHVVVGYFGKTWANYAGNLGRKVLKVGANGGDGIDLTKLKIPKEAEIICITQNDTSTGIWLPPEDIYSLKRRYPEKLLALDLVSALPYVKLDYKYIDAAFFSVQKGFGLPAGLGVMIVSPKVLHKAQTLAREGINIGSYHSLVNLLKSAEKWETPETPNVMNIYLLSKVIKDLQRKTLAKIRAETDEKAKLLYNFFENHKEYSPYVKNPKYRSPTTLVFDVKGKSESIRKKLAKSGFIIGAGYGFEKENHIRIANFPAHRKATIKRMLRYIGN